MSAANYFLALTFFSASASICDRFLLPATQPSLRATPDALSSVQPWVTPAASRLPLRPRLKPSVLASSLSFGIGHSWFLGGRVRKRSLARRSEAAVGGVVG